MENEVTNPKSPIEVLRQALRDVLPTATPEQINRIADAVCAIAHPIRL
jgi:hypothetical protein